MKGELPVNIVIIMAVFVLVLIVIMFFFFSRQGETVSTADATKLFYSTCTEYKANNCQWSLTKKDEFSSFLKSCQTLFGSDKQEYSCLYTFCPDCKAVDIPQVNCAGQCSLCNGNKLAGIPTEECCSTYNAKCSSVLKCDAC